MINFDMPEEIENYVHRIGRTGRRGRTGLATTFVSLKDNSEVILLDLKHLLKESKQPIPPVLQARLWAALPLFACTPGTCHYPCCVTRQKCMCSMYSSFGSWWLACM